MSQHKKSGFWNTLKFEEGMAWIFPGTAKEETMFRLAVSAGYAWAMKKPENREAVIGMVQVRDVQNVPGLMEAIGTQIRNAPEYGLECILKHICLAVRLGAEEYIRTSKERNRQHKQAMTIRNAVDGLAAKNAEEHRA